MLKYEKSKSKLVEFAVAKENYPKYQLNPDDLTYTTMYALSRFCEEMIENPQSSQISELKDDLAIVSQYYDSTVKTQLRSKYSKWFLLLGSTSYFLSENFGSGKLVFKRRYSDPTIYYIKFFAYRKMGGGSYRNKILS